MRFLFCSMNSYGFLFPSLGTALALRARGHEIAFVADVGLAGDVERAGFRRIPRGSPDGPSFILTNSAEPLEILRQVRHVERALEHFPADVLVTQPAAFGPYLAAERTGLPVATLGVASYMWPKAEPPASPWLRDYLAQRYRRFVLSYDMLRAMLGLQQRVQGLADNPLLGDLLLLRTVPELEGDPHLLPPQVHCVGDCLWELPAQADPALSAWLGRARDSGEPLVYAQPGRTLTGASYWPSLVEALGNGPVRMAASVGRVGGPLVETPENVFARPHVPQSLVLPQARAVISSATSTAVLGALTHGLPLLLIPTEGAEQVDMTYRCLRAKVALHLPEEEATPERLREKVEELLAREDLRRNAATLQAAFRKAGGHEQAAALIEGLGHRHQEVRAS
jgi:MGT family glycosyltransferase